MTTAALLTSLDANWHRMISVPKERVDLLVCWPSSTEGPQRGDSNPQFKSMLTVIKDAVLVFEGDDSVWRHPNDSGSDISLPARSLPIAWRPLQVRHDAETRAVDIENMLNFLRSSKAIKDATYQRVGTFLETLRAAIK